MKKKALSRYFISSTQASHETEIRSHIFKKEKAESRECLKVQDHRASK